MGNKKTSQKSHPSLVAGIGVGVFAGVAIGYFIGSGIEDLIRSVSSVEYPVLLVKAIPAGLGALGLSGLAFLQYLNKDEHEGMLVMRVIEGVEPEKLAVQPQPDLEGLARAVEGLTGGVQNTALAGKLYKAVAGVLSRNPFDGPRNQFEARKNGFFVNSFGVFDTFTYKGREVDPKETLERFFERGDALYRMAVEAFSSAAERAVTGHVHSGKANGKRFTREFKGALKQEVALAQDVALWLTYLSKRGGIVGSNVRTQLAQLGITNPDYFARDVEVLGGNVLQLYDGLQNGKTSGA